MDEVDRLEIETIIRINNGWGENLECKGLRLGARTVWARFDSRDDDRRGRAAITYRRNVFELLRQRFRAGESVKWRDVDTAINRLQP